MSRDIRKLARDDGRYRVAAFQFLFESLEPAIHLTKREGESLADRHLSGTELLTGLCSEATRLFGPLAAHVWNSWGVREPLDWGNIVFLLVDEGLLSRREEDTIDDFRVDMNFEQVFVKGYQLKLPKEVGPGPTGNVE
jgi:uncharacterized repeat protein (TIGR04138 family)